MEDSDQGPQSVSATGLSPTDRPNPAADMSDPDRPFTPPEDGEFSEPLPRSATPPQDPEPPSIQPVDYEKQGFTTVELDDLKGVQETDTEPDVGIIRPRMDNSGYISDVKTENGEVSLVNMNKVDPEQNGKAMQNGKAHDDKEGEEDKKKKKEETKMVSPGALFRFADKWDKLFMFLGWTCAAAHGTSLPLLLLVFGDMTDVFINAATSNTTEAFLRAINYTGQTYTYEDVRQDPINLQPQIAQEQGLQEEYSLIAKEFTGDLVDEMSKFALYYVGIAVGVIFVAWGQVTFSLMAAFRQTHRLRIELFRSIMRMEIGWYDVHEAGELNTRLTDDVNKVTEGIGDKIGNFFQWFSCFVAGMVIGFVYGWKLTLVILAFAPLLAICGGFMTMLLTQLTSKELQAYAKAGAVAEEVLGAIRTVYAFNGQKKEVERYSANLKEAMTFGRRKGIVNGGGMGVVMFVIFVVYCVIFWYGCKLVREDFLKDDPVYTPGVMLIVFFCVVFAAFALGNAAPSIASFSTSRGAAFTLWEIVDTVPLIDSSSSAGEKPPSLTGNIEFRNVKFRYPARNEVVVMDGVSLSVNVGQTAALVGPSGCGKSTTVQLIQRFYDPEEGAVLLDGKDIRQLNVNWLRQQIGIVSQEPILFGTTIGENIRYGRDGVTQEEIEAAAKKSNAHDFVMNLPNKYDTLCGERGAQLSGGQKQRIAIARALVRNPKILLLDEATSALDTESEAGVQAALDVARQGRTTLVIAHRLSTVRTADMIIGMEAGTVRETGTHDQLMEQGGIYCTLVTNQSQHGVEEEDDELDASMSEVQLKRQNSGPVQRQLSRKISEGKGGKLERSKSLSEDKEEDEDLPEVSAGRLWKLNASEWPYIVVGVIAAMINGAIQPLFAIVFAEILGLFVLPLDEQEDKALLYSLMFLVIGFATLIGYFFQGFALAVSGEFLTMRLRKMAFKAYLRQEIGYFDDHKNNVGALTTRLATDASAVQGATGARLGTIVSTLSSIGTGIIIGFIYSWKLTLGILAFVPFILAAGVLQMKMLGGYTKEGNEALEAAGKVAIEGIENIRTVAALTKEETFVQWYKSKLTGPFKVSMKRAIVNGATFSITQALIFFAYAASFYLGAYLVKNDGLSFENMFKVFSAIVFSAMQAGNANSMAPDYKKAMVAAARLFKLLDREPVIDNMSEEGTKPSGVVNGTVEFKNVVFSYPTRDTVTVLQGLDLQVHPGQTLALVGSSGCGKSTTVQLLERFYDPADGQVMLDGQITSQLNIQWLRSHLGIVSQEPILFDASIRDNVAYGDNSREVPMNEIIQAARNANIHSFIDSLPDGYDTNVGDKGTQLSGGQKQRIAIARALVRNPKILLLDEATSALDTESEKVVQEALDRAQEGRTSIVIAHRLSTIQNADAIAVIHHGQVVEQGTHSELLELKGKYYKLYTTQKHRK